MIRGRRRVLVWMAGVAVGLGCGKPWRVVARVSRDPLHGQNRVGLAHIVFPPTAIDGALDDPAAAFAANDKGFAERLVATSTVAIEPANQSHVVTVRATATSVRSGAWESRVELVVRIGAHDTADEIVVASTVQARVAPYRRDRLTRVGEGLGSSVARYITERVGS